MNSSQQQKLSELKFENLALNYFPIEENEEQNVHKVQGYIYSKVKPTPLNNPKIIALSESALNLIQSSTQTILQEEKLSQEILSGNYIIPDSQPLAHCYCGYQFGQWAGQLGDGRAITLGDYRNQSNGQIWELQLKGAGKTPYSRFADGRAVLRSSIREFLCSEALHHLGIPTTRAMSIVVSDDTIERDPLYQGKVIQEKCSVVCRMASSWIRFGSFEICIKGGPSYHKQLEFIPLMLNFLIQHHFKDLQQYENFNQRYLELYKEIVRRTAKLVALWQTVGFCHGVLNTDNMSVLGLTIDFGPFGFMDNFDKRYICNYSDHSGRYSYENQPEICKWNLMKLAEALSCVIPFEQMREFLQTSYDAIYQKQYYSKMRQKLGLFNKMLKDDKQLIDNLMDIMHQCGNDFTNTFRKFSKVSIQENFQEQLEMKDRKILEEILNQSATLSVQIQKYQPKITEDQLNELKQIQKNNPYLLQLLGYDQEMINEQEKIINEWNKLKNQNHDNLQQKNRILWENWLNQYKKRLSQEIQIDDKNNLSDSLYAEKNLEEINKLRAEKMNKVNPNFILRNYILQIAIEKAEKEDYSELQNLLKLIQNPFDDHVDSNQKQYQCKPNWAHSLCVSCSS